jgi:hypothetical protein
MRRHATGAGRIAGVYVGAAFAAAGMTAGCFSSSGGEPTPDGSVDSTVPGDAGADAVGDADTMMPERPEAAAEAGLGAMPEPSIEAGPEGSPEASPEAQAPDAAAPTCGPLDAGSFTIPPYAHQIPSNTQYCDAGIGNLAAECLGDAATYAACNASRASLDPACASCLLTNDAGSTGSLVGPGLPSTNLAGCIALSDPSDAGQGCAAAVEAALACAQAACPCPATDDPSARALQVCMTAAASGVCSVYAQAASACLTSEAADNAIPNCPVGVPADQQFLALAAFFCKS